MKILYFAPHQIWPLNGGARIRDYQLARELALRSEVTFVEMRNETGERKDHAPPEDCSFAEVITFDKYRTYSPFKLMKGLAGPVPVTILNCWSRSVASRLTDVLRSGHFDTVQIEGVHLMEYLPIIQEAAGSAAVVVDWHNIESEIMWRYAKNTGNWAKRIVAKRTAKLIERAEDKLLGSHVTHTVTSERERQKLLARHSSANVDVIPNGVDSSYYSLANIKNPKCQSVQHRSKPTILFVGSMDYHANIDAVTWFSRTVWPEIARNHPDLQFTIVGRDPGPEVRALVCDRIHVTGSVDDVRPFYTAAVAAVVPLRSASGTRLKVLEAMAAGVPVVSTSIGAEGIELEDDVHLLFADAPREIVSAVGKLLLSSETRSRLTHAARELVSNAYDWSAIGKRLYGIHAALMESRAHRSLQRVS
jgi:sugar transferase (PEP-CTERM/EpsH1 system associated)